MATPSDHRPDDAPYLEDDKSDYNGNLSPGRIQKMEALSQVGAQVQVPSTPRPSSFDPSIKLEATQTKSRLGNSQSQSVSNGEAHEIRQDPEDFSSETAVEEDANANLKPFDWEGIQDQYSRELQTIDQEESDLLVNYERYSNV
jgi:hypothetical protein